MSETPSPCLGTAGPNEAFTLNRKYKEKREIPDVGLRSRLGNLLITARFHL